MSKMRSIKLLYFNLTFYGIIQKDLHSAKVTACVLFLRYLSRHLNLKYILNTFNSSIELFFL